MFIAYMYMQNQGRIDNWESEPFFLEVFKSKMAAKSKVAACKLI